MQHLMRSGGGRKYKVGGTHERKLGKLLSRIEILEKCNNLNKLFRWS